MAKEAWPAARWLTARGYTAYILSYRLPGEGWGAGALAPLQDAQRALRLIRAREEQVSLLGFSAGGHLLGMAACRADFAAYSPQDALDDRPARADKAALIYPIISLMSPYSHTATHRMLAGPMPQRRLTAPGRSLRQCTDAALLSGPGGGRFGVRSA
jgi:acetyl esterase/lipase